MQAQALNPHGFLVIALTASQPSLHDEAQAMLRRQYGPCLAASDVFDFSAFTGYYAEEMGEGLIKQFLVFESSMEIETLPEYKHASNAAEEQWTENGCRKVNIDPGYLTLSKLVLASTKDHAHRLYIGKNIYAEITLQFKGTAFTPLPWTYPDYAAPEHLDFFTNARNTIHGRVKARIREYR